MYNVGHVILEDDIAGERFACDMGRCKGRCCTMYGERGAPLMDGELQEIEKAFPKIIEFLPAAHLEVIRRHGMVDGKTGDYYTVCVDYRACVFVYYENDIARCAFEKAFFMGLIQWQKPLSCHLFPVRVRGHQTDHLYYERIQECVPGRENGMITDVPLIRFVRCALIRKYGAEWYAQALYDCKQTKDIKDLIV